MIDFTAFFTPQAGNGKGASGQQPQALAARAGIIADPGMSFMDLIFARVTADGEQQDKAANMMAGIKAKTHGQGSAPESKPDYTPHAEPLTIAQILHAAFAGDQQALEKIGEMTPEELAALQTAFAANGGAAVETETKAAEPAKISLAEALASVKAALEMPADPETLPETKEPAPGKEITLAAAHKKMAAALESLLAGMPQESKTLKIDDAAPALIATGLTPEKLTQLLEDIADGNEQGEAFIIGLAKILPPAAKKEAIFLPRGIVIAQPQHPAGDVNTPKPANDLAARLNALITGGQEGANTSGTSTAAEGDSAYEENDFEGVLRVLERAQGMGRKTGQQGDFDKGIANAMRQIGKNVGAGLSTVQGGPPALSEIFTTFAMDSVYPEGLDFGYSPQHGQNLTGTAQLASLVSHAQQAGHPHPATQMVAATIAKTAAGGESKTISIQLDPPDLGRVSVRMEFHKDNTIKAVLMAEKPETHLMLQRDAHVLERALQEAGIDTDGSSLSFELAQDGNLFGHEQKDENGAGGGSAGAEGDDAGETGTEIATLQTTMDWYADPETGLMRYSALV